MYFVCFINTMKTKTKLDSQFKTYRNFLNYCDGFVNLINVDAAASAGNFFLLTEFFLPTVANVLAHIVWLFLPYIVVGS